MSEIKDSEVNKKKDFNKEEKKVESKYKIAIVGNGQANIRKTLAALIAGGMVVGGLTGCGVGSNEMTIVDKSDTQYQYSVISLDNVEVKQGRKSTSLSEFDGAVTLASPCYSGSTLSVYIDGELYETELSNFVMADGIEWLYDGQGSLPYDIEVGAMPDPSKMTATITYTDGTELPITAEYVEVTVSGDVAELYCVVGSTTFYASLPVSEPVEPTPNPVFDESTESESSVGDEESEEGTEDSDESTSGESSDIESSEEESEESSQVDNEDVESSEEPEESTEDSDIVLPSEEVPDSSEE